MIDWVTKIDFAILDFIQDYLKCGFLDWLMPRISAMGNSGIIWILIAIAFLFTKNYRKQGLVLAIGLLVGFLIGNLTLKPLIARMRPSWINTEIELLIRNPLDFSFPSGHTLSSFIAAILITLNNKKLGIVVLPLAALIAFSRMYLYVHFPSDILGGIILAFIISLSVHKIFYREKLNK